MLAQPICVSSDIFRASVTSWHHRSCKLSQPIAHHHSICDAVQRMTVTLLRRGRVAYFVRQITGVQRLLNKHYLLCMLRGTWRKRTALCILLLRHCS